MTPVKQTRVGDKGNCLQACIASLLDLPIDDVPHFILYKANWFAALELFLEDYGYEYEGLSDPDNISNHEGIDGYFIATGISPRGRVHAVIYKDGELFHDPHPEGGGISLEHLYMIKRKTQYHQNQQ